VDHVTDSTVRWFAIDSAYRFDSGTDSATMDKLGQDANVLYDGADSDDEKTSFSVEAWFRPDATAWSNVDDQILGETGGGNGYGLVLEDIAGGSRLKFQIRNSSNPNPAEKGPVDVSFDLLDGVHDGLLDDYLHVIGVVDPFDPTEKMRLYLNAHLVDSVNDMVTWWDAAGDGAGVGSLGGSNMGGFGSGNQGFSTFIGDMAIFRLWDDAIDDEFAVELWTDVVPEPTTLTLLGLGGLGLLRRRRRAA
jgi:hypothetical protein